MKFKRLEEVRKPKGYNFDSTVLGTVQTTEGSNRVIAQIDTKVAEVRTIDILNELGANDEQLREVLAYVGNANGLIHIFSEGQLEYDSN